MISVSVSHDLTGLQQRLGLMVEERRKAALRAANRTMTTVRKEASDELRSEYPGLRVGAIKAQLKITRATGSTPVASITFTAKRFRLFLNWNARQTRAGVALGRLPWRIETGDGEAIPAQMLAHAFIQRTRAVRAGAPNVWLRAGGSRYPIEVLVAPGLARAVVERRLLAALSRLTRERFGVVFQQEARFQLSRR